LVAAAVAGCIPESKVTRVYDGQLVHERFVTPEAYASFLDGVLAEEKGDLRAALKAYSSALEEDDEDPEIWARLGEVRCRLDAKDPEADRALSRALKMDPTYASALAAKARCALVRGDATGATTVAASAAAQDPKNVGLEALYLRAASARPSAGAGVDSAVRERAVALTLAKGEHAAAWDALLAWGRARRDAELVARALEGLVRAAPSRSVDAERGAVLLAADGQIALARRVAVAVADAPRALGVLGPRDAVVARLAVDEALARGDEVKARARATRGHVDLAEVAARAALLDRREIAASLVATVSDADPSSSGAQMVKASLRSTGGGSPGAAAKVRPPEGLGRVADRPPELCALLFADSLAAAAGPDVAREWLAQIVRTPMPANDPLAAPLAADLVKRGVLPAEIATEGRGAAQPQRGAR